MVELSPKHGPAIGWIAAPLPPPHTVKNVSLNLTFKQEQIKSTVMVYLKKNHRNKMCFLSFRTLFTVYTHYIFYISAPPGSKLIENWVYRYS